MLAIFPHLRTPPCTTLYLFRGTMRIKRPPSSTTERRRAAVVAAATAANPVISDAAARAAANLVANAATRGAIGLGLEPDAPAQALATAGDGAHDPLSSEGNADEKTLALEAAEEERLAAEDDQDAADDAAAEAAEAAAAAGDAAVAAANAERAADAAAARAESTAKAAREAASAAADAQATAEAAADASTKASADVVVHAAARVKARAARLASLQVAAKALPDAVEEDGDIQAAGNGDSAALVPMNSNFVQVNVVGLDVLPAAEHPFRAGCVMPTTAGAAGVLCGDITTTPPADDGPMQDAARRALRLLATNGISLGLQDAPDEARVVTEETAVIEQQAKRARRDGPSSPDGAN